MHFNRNTIKLSYSTCRNLKAYIDAHNRNILQPNITEKFTCNCQKRNKANCPLQGQCTASNIVYEAKVTVGNEEPKVYFGQTLRPFKQRYYEHNTAINNRPKERNNNKPKQNNNKSKEKEKGGEKCDKDKKDKKGSDTSTALSNFIWKIKDAGKQFKLTWSIKSRAPTYKSGSRKCQLCLKEKTAIALCPPQKLLNCRTELLGKCIHLQYFELKKYAPK